MLKKCRRPSSHTLVASLCECAKLKDIHRGQEIHAEAARHGLAVEVHVGSTLVDMYFKCNLPCMAQEVFDNLSVRNIVSWNSLIAGYTAKGLPQKAFDCFKAMRASGILPSSVTYVCILKACGSMGAIDEGEAIHQELSERAVDKELFVASALVDMYTSFGIVAKAEAAFERTAVRDVVAWSSLIRAYAEYGHGKEALQAYQQMQIEGIAPDTHTFLCSLKACGSTGAVGEGNGLYASIAMKVLDGDAFIGSALIDMYANLGLFCKAQEVFDNLHCQDAVPWNALIAGYVKHGHHKEAVDCYSRMKRKGLSPTIATFVSTLKACSNIGAIDIAKAIQTEIHQENLAADLVVGSALVDMYANCGFFHKAREVFDKIKDRNVITWTALISGYVKYGASEEALDCFEQMGGEGFEPEPATLACVLKACGLLGASSKGSAVHASVARKALDRELILGSTLVDMYASCCLLSRAQEVFDRLAVRDAASWNALLIGYAQLGECDIVFDSFDKMSWEGLVPTVASIISVLNVCSHAGLVEYGKAFFGLMSESYDIMTLTLQNHNCLVDLVGRAGLWQESLAVIEKMPFLPNLVAWHTILGAVRKSLSVELGQKAFEQALELDMRDSSTYLYMVNIYSDAEIHQNSVYIL